MRVAAIPCPFCRVLVELPRSGGGVDDFPDPAMWQQQPKSEDECLTPTNVIVNSEGHNQEGGIEHTGGHVNSPLTGQAHVRFVFPDTDLDQTRSTMSVNITTSSITARDGHEMNREPDVGVRKLTVIDNDTTLGCLSLPGDRTDSVDNQEINNNTIVIDSKMTRAGSSIDMGVASRSTPSVRWQSSTYNCAFPKSMAFTSTSRGSSVVAEYGLGRLNFIDATGETEYSVSGVKPYSVATDYAGRIMVGDRKSRTLVILDSEGREVGNWSAGCFPWIVGIGVLRNGNIVICDRNFARIGIYSASGDRITEFGSYGTGSDQMCMADYITVDGRDRIIVSDSANHCIKIFDVTGSLLTKFGSRGSADGKLCWPHGVCCRGNGSDEILVADTVNERITLFSSNGTFIDHILSDIARPIGICCKDGLLGVTHYGKSGYSQCNVYSY